MSIQEVVTNILVFKNKSSNNGNDYYDDHYDVTISDLMNTILRCHAKKKSPSYDHRE